MDTDGVVEMNSHLSFLFEKMCDDFALDCPVVPSDWANCSCSIVLNMFEHVYINWKVNDYLRGVRLGTWRPKIWCYLDL